MNREQAVKKVAEGGRGTSLCMKRSDYSLLLLETGWNCVAHGSNTIAGESVERIL